MKYTNQWVIDNGKKDFLFFWGNDSKAPFSQWQPTPFTVNGNIFHTAEHFMMYHKALIFDDVETSQAVLHNPNPAAVKRMGRLIKEFDAEKWDRVKFKIVLSGSIYKFMSTPELQRIFLETGDKVLVEASPYDKIWGIGMGIDHPNINDPAKWKGENLLGYALMEARDVIS